MGTATTPTTARVAANVRAEIAARRITGQQLAANVGGSSSTMYRRLAGEVAWPDHVLEAVADFLGVPLQSLFADRAA